jgi:hypothetical protein
VRAENLCKSLVKNMAFYSVGKRKRMRAKMRALEG